MPSRKITDAIAALVAWNWRDEEDDYWDNCSDEPDGNQRSGHIFESLVLIQEWLETEYDYQRIKRRGNPDAPRPASPVLQSRTGDVTGMAGHMAQAAGTGLIRAARDWIADCSWGDLGPDDVADLTDEQVYLGIRDRYDGGWAQFIADGAALPPMKPDRT